MLVILFSAVAGAQDVPAAEVVVEDTAPEIVDPSETTASVTVIEVDARLGASADTAAALRTAPGVTVRSFGGLGSWSTASIRGSDSRQVQVYLDGVPLNPDGSGAVNLAELPLGAFERIAVYRGNAPARYGALPIGGVVDLQTGSARTKAGSVWASHGGLNTWRLGGVGTLPGHIGSTPTDGFLAVDGFTTDADFSYFSDSGTVHNLSDDHMRSRDNNDKHQASVHGRWRVGDERLRFTMLDALVAREEGIPGAGTSFRTGARLATMRNLAVLSTSGLAGPVRLGGRVWHQYRAETYDDREGLVGTGTQHSTYRTHNLGFTGTAQGTVGRHISLDGATELRLDRFQEQDRLSDKTSGQAQRIASTTTASADLRFWHERLHFSPSVQLQILDNRQLGGALPSDPLAPTAHTEPVVAVHPRLGVRVQPVPWLTFKSNIGSYLRAPDFNELYGDRGLVKGNAELVPERGWSVDLGARLEMPAHPWLAGSLDLTGYTGERRDLIVMVSNAQKVLVPINIGAADVSGLEVALSAELAGVLDSQTTVSWTHAINRSSKDEWAGNQLPRIPRLELYQATSVHYRQLLRLGHTFSYTDGNYWDATNWHRAAPRPIHGLFVRARPGRGAPDFEVELINLLDTRVQVVDRNPLDPNDTGRVVQPITDFNAYPLPGRTVMFTVRWSGTKKENTL